MLCIVNPLLASVVLTLMLGAGLIAAGLVRAYLATQIPADQPRFMVFLAAAVTTLLGLIIVSHWPLDSVYVLGTSLGVRPPVSWRRLGEPALAELTILGLRAHVRSEQ